MRADPISYLTRLLVDLRDVSGQRDAASLITDQCRTFLGARTSFLVLTGPDRDIANVAASSGVGAADFRRLEERISRSSLWRILDDTRPFLIDDLALDNALSFLAFGSGTKRLFAVPIRTAESAVGLLAVGFAAGDEVDQSLVLRILDPTAAIFSFISKVEELKGREDQRAAEESRAADRDLRRKYDLGKLVGNSGVMQSIFGQIRQIARSNAVVLVRGETGTGKELIANAIHYNSLRSKRPLVKVSCSALPGPAADRELFGALEQADGRESAVHRADGGTLFLEEVAALSLPTQIKLLRLIRDREFTPVGSGSILPANIRLIASTGKNLEEAVADGSLREDLFYKLSVFSIFLPPLRERKPDILLLAEHFLERFDTVYKKDIRRLSTPAIDMLSAYHFPGNVRELENVIERAVLDCDSSVIHGHHLPPTLQTAELTGTETRLGLASSVAAFERDLIQDALKSTRGNIAKAADMLESTERILGYKIKKYRIDPRRFKR